MNRAAGFIRLHSTPPCHQAMPAMHTATPGPMPLYDEGARCFAHNLKLSYTSDVGKGELQTHCSSEEVVPQVQKGSDQQMKTSLSQNNLWKRMKRARPGLAKGVLKVQEGNTSWCTILRVHNSNLHGGQK